MDTAETIATRLADMGRREILSLMRAIDFFELAGIWNHAVAHAWRTAARFRVAELSVPPAEA
jgi:hypothetical protein